MRQHVLHLKVANVMRNIVGNKYKVLLDSDCGGNQQLPFFLSVNASREAAVSKVDLMIVDSKKVKLVCEIEESGFNPTKIYGKVFSTGSAIMSKLNNDTKFDIDRQGVFIQIISSDKIEEKLIKPKHTKKYDQGKIIEDTIRVMLTKTDSWIKEYHLIFSRIENNNIDADSENRISDIINKL